MAHERLLGAYLFELIDFPAQEKRVQWAGSFTPAAREALEGFVKNHHAATALLFRLHVEKKKDAGEDGSTLSSTAESSGVTAATLFGGSDPISESSSSSGLTGRLVVVALRV